jgi:hypothetical protein
MSESKNTADEKHNELTMDMIRAGIAAYERWNYSEEEVAALVAAIYYACERERVRKTPDE